MSDVDDPGMLPPHANSATGLNQWPECRVYWGSHGCNLRRRHEGHCRCSCANPTEPGNVGAHPYYGPDTRFYGEDVEARGLLRIKPVGNAPRSCRVNIEDLRKELERLLAPEMVECPVKPEPYGESPLRFWMMEYTRERVEREARERSYPPLLWSASIA